MTPWHLEIHLSVFLNFLKVERETLQKLGGSIFFLKNNLRLFAKQVIIHVYEVDCETSYLNSHKSVLTAHTRHIHLIFDRRLKMLQLSVHTYHAVYLKVDVEVCRDAVELDQIGKVETSAHQRVVCRQHLCCNHLWAISNQDHEEMSGVV